MLQKEKIVYFVFWIIYESNNNYGGRRGTRTPNLLIWNQPLYQLELYTLKEGQSKQRDCPGFILK
tara:strand:+ start:945 stop:1139 length:195 start_codon:yes stop_codon:yes gene_type:complete